MKWRRKILSMILALSMALSMIGVAHADLGQSAQAEAYARMNALKLANGIARTDGTVDPALGADITRAQMVTIIVRAFGKEADAQLLTGISLFPDVAASHWASGYITVAKRIAEDKGFSIGRPGGVFDPDAKVTNAEVLAFIMKFLGIARDTTLSWPMDYIQAAEDAGLITDDDSTTISLIANASASRGLAFVLADSIFYNYKGLPGGDSVYTAHVDEDAPQITITSSTPSETEEELVTIAGSVDADVVSLSLEGKSISVSASGTFSVSTKLAFGTNILKLLAVDRAGNTGDTSVTIVRKSPVPVGPLVREVRADKTTVGTFEKVQLTAVTEAGEPISEGVTWSADSDNVIITANGVFQSPVPGRYAVTAKVGSSSSFITINVYGPAAKLRIESSALVANGVTKQTVKVIALDKDYVQVANFGNNGETVSLSGLGLTVFDESGVETTEVEAKGGVATFQVTVSAALAGESVNVTATHGSGDSEITETATIETTFPVPSGLKAEGPKIVAANTGFVTRDGAIKVWVVDQNGAPVNEVFNVSAQVTGPSTLVNTSDSYLGPDNPAKFDISNYNHVGITGPIYLTFTVDGLSSTTLTISQLIAGSPAKLEVKAEKASVKATETFTLTVTSQDRNGVPVPLNSAQDTELTVKLPDAVTDKFTLPDGNPTILAGESSANFTLKATAAFTGNLNVSVTGGNLTGTATVTVVAGDIFSRAFDREKALAPLAAPEATFYGFVSDAMQNPIPVSGIAMKVFVQEVSGVGAVSGTDTNRVTINGRTTSFSRPLTVTTNAEGKVELRVVAPPQSNKTYMVQLTDANGADPAYTYLTVVPTVPGSMTVSTYRLVDISGGTYMSTSQVTAGDEFYVKVTVTDNYGGPVMGIADDLKIASPKIFSANGITLTESSVFVFESWDWWTLQNPTLAEDLKLAEGDYVALVYAGKSGYQDVKVAYDLTVDNVTGSKRIDVKADEFVGLLVNDGNAIKVKANTVTGPYTIRLADQFDNQTTTSLSQEITWTVSGGSGSVGIRTSQTGGNVISLTTRSIASFYLDVNTPGMYDVTFYAGGYTETITIEVTNEQRA